MNRAERRRRAKLEKKNSNEDVRAKAVNLLKTPVGQEIMVSTVDVACQVLKRDFGFGEKRLQRFMEGMMRGGFEDDESGN